MNTLIRKNENIARLAWTGFVLIFFILQAILWAVAISKTAGDRSHAVVSGYAEQAMRWDEVKQSKLESDRLGWTAKIAVNQSADVRGNRTITVRVYDKHDNPVADADVSMLAFHIGQAADTQNLKLQLAEPGVYSGTLNVQKSGNWEIRGTAKTSEAEFLFEQRLWLETYKGGRQ